MCLLTQSKTLIYAQAERDRRSQRRDAEDAALRATLERKKQATDAACDADGKNSTMLEKARKSHFLHATSLLLAHTLRDSWLSVESMRQSVL